jgi:hypothetical protein
MDPLKDQSLLSKSPASFFFIVSLSVFVSEASVMLLLYYLPQMSLIGEAIIDATLLIAVVSPVLYFFLFRPLVVHVREREQIEDVLHEKSSSRS